MRVEKGDMLVNVWGGVWVAPVRDETGEPLFYFGAACPSFVSYGGYYLFISKRDSNINVSRVTAIARTEVTPAVSGGVVTLENRATCGGTTTTKLVVTLATYVIYIWPTRFMDSSFNAVVNITTLGTKR